MMQLQKKKKERFFIGIRGKLSICFILLLLIVMAFIDVAVYQIYQGDIEQKEIASMTDSGAILSDNIHNLLGNLEEDLMFDIQRSKLFGYLTDDWELSEPNTERKMHTLGTLLHFRGLECTDIFILDRNDSTFFCNYLKNGSTFADFENKEIYHRILETQEALFPAKGCTIWRSCEDSPDELYMIKSYIDPVSLDYYGIVCITISNADFKELLGEYNFDIALYDEQQSFLQFKICYALSARRSEQLSVRLNPDPAKSRRLVYGQLYFPCRCISRPGCPDAYAFSDGGAAWHCGHFYRLPDHKGLPVEHYRPYGKFQTHPQSGNISEDRTTLS